MTGFERSVALLHWNSDLSLEDAEAVIKGLAPLEEDWDDDEE